MTNDETLSVLVPPFKLLSELDGKMDDLQQHIAVLQDELAELCEQRSVAEQAILDVCTEAGLDNAAYPGYQVRFTKGRSSTRWDASKLAEVLPPELRDVALTYTPKADTKVLTALEKSGKLPEDALQAKTVTPASPRLVLERVVEGDPEA